MYHSNKYVYEITLSPHLTVLAQSLIHSILSNQDTQHQMDCCVSTVLTLLAWKSHQLSMFTKMHHSRIPYFRTVLDAFISMGPYSWRIEAHLQNIWMPAGWYWMPLAGLSRISAFSEQLSLVVRNIRASFGPWNSIPQPHLYSNKQLWMYS